MIFCYLSNAVTFCNPNITYGFPTLASELDMQFYNIQKTQYHFNSEQLKTFNILASWVFFPLSHPIPFLPCLILQGQYF